MTRKKRKPKTKAKTPRRVSTRKRTRSAKGIYYDDHFEESNSETVESVALIPVSEPESEEGNLSAEDEGSNTTVPVPNSNSEATVIVNDVFNNSTSLTLSEETPLVLEEATPNLHTCYLNSLTDPTRAICTKESEFPEMATPVGIARIAHRDNNLSLKRELELALAASTRDRGNILEKPVRDKFDFPISVVNVDTSIVKEIKFQNEQAINESNDMCGEDENRSLILLNNVYELYKINKEAFKVDMAKHEAQGGVDDETEGVIVQDETKDSITSQRIEETVNPEFEAKVRTIASQTNIYNQKVEADCERLKGELFLRQQQLKIAQDRINQLQEHNTYRKEVIRLEEMMEVDEREKAKLKEDILKSNEEKAKLINVNEKKVNDQKELITNLKKENEMYKALVQEVEKEKNSIIEKLENVRNNKTKEVMELTNEKSEIIAILEKQNKDYTSLEEVVESNVKEMTTLRKELDVRMEEIKILEENKTFLMNENMILKNKLKAVPSSMKTRVMNEAAMEKVEGQEMYGDIVETISTLTQAMEYTGDNFDLIMKEIEQFKRQQKLTNLKLEYLQCSSQRDTMIQHKQPPQPQQQYQHEHHQQVPLPHPQPHLPLPTHPHPQPYLPTHPHPLMPPPPSANSVSSSVSQPRQHHQPKPPPQPLQATLPQQQHQPPHIRREQQKQSSPTQQTRHQNPFHPLRFVNNNDETDEISSQSWFKPVRPGFKTYSEVTTGTKKSVIFSTSMTKGIRPEIFHRNHYKHGRASFHRFHGGKARHIRNQIETHLQEELPDAAIIHVGGNDLQTNRGVKPTPVLDLANQILDTALLCRKYGVRDVVVSSILPRKESYSKDVEKRRLEVNEIVKSLCDLNSMVFLDNDVGDDKITYPGHMYDGVHLTDEGSELLSRRFGNVLNALHGG